MYYASDPEIAWISMVTQQFKKERKKNPKERMNS